MGSERALGDAWHAMFNRYAADLFPGKYTLDACRDMAAMGRPPRRDARRGRAGTGLHPA